MYLTQSIKDNWAEIIVGVALITILLMSLSMYNITFEDVNGIINKYGRKDGEAKEKSMDTIEIVYEGMSNKFDELCDDTDNLEQVCANLGSGSGKKHSCNLVKCCVWATNDNTSECVEGDETGPMFKTDKNGMRYDEYYYQNKKFPMKK